jgi:hypothetical protein
MPSTSASNSAVPLDPFAGQPSPDGSPVDPFAGQPSSNGSPIDPFSNEAKSAPTAEKPLDPFADALDNPAASPKASSSRSKVAPGVPLDPFPPAAGGVNDGVPSAAPVDPYASIPSVSAPAKAPAKTKPMDPYGVAPSTAPVQPPAKNYTVTVTRSEVDTALSDFDRLSREVQLEQNSNRGFKVVGVATGSLAYRLGLRQDDVILSVAGIRLKTLDDAARVYVRVARASTVRVRLRRGGKRFTVTVAIKG